MRSFGSSEIVIRSFSDWLISGVVVGIGRKSYRHTGSKFRLPGMTTRIEWFSSAGEPIETTNSFVGSILERCRMLVSKGVIMLSPTIAAVPG